MGNIFFIDDIDKATDSEIPKENDIVDEEYLGYGIYILTLTDGSKYLWEDKDDASNKAFHRNGVWDENGFPIFANER